MRKLILVLTLFLVSCQKDGITYNAPPTLDCKATILNDNVVLLQASMSGEVPCIRGFVLSLSDTCSIDYAIKVPERSKIIGVKQGTGLFYALKQVIPGLYVRSYAYYEGRANDIGYSKVIKIPVNNQ